MTQELVSLHEAARRLKIKKAAVERLISEHGLKMVLRGRLRLVRYAELQAVVRPEDTQEAGRRDADFYRDALIQHLERSISDLKAEVLELREERRQDRHKVEALLLENSRLKLGTGFHDVDVAAHELPRRQGASAAPFDLDELCHEIDKRRGVSEGVPRPSDESSGRTWFGWIWSRGKPLDSV